MISFGELYILFFLKCNSCISEQENSLSLGTTDMSNRSLRMFVNG